jgi:hypothetical protein
VDIDAVMVEAEPQHCEWAHLNMADNHIDRFELIEAAVAAQDGEALFCIRWPQGQNARDFYGQVLMPADVQTRSTAETYYGRPILVFYGSWEGIMINTRSYARSSVIATISISWISTFKGLRATLSQTPRSRLIFAQRSLGRGGILFMILRSGACE